MHEVDESYITGWNTGYFCLPFPGCVPTSKAWLIGFEHGEQERIADVYKNKEQKVKVSTDEIQDTQQLRNLRKT